MLNKSKYYFKSIYTPVRINNNAKIYSIIFLVFKLPTKILSELPNIAHNEIEGKQTKGAVKAKNIVAFRKFSS